MARPMDLVRKTLLTLRREGISGLVERLQRHVTPALRRSVMSALARLPVDLSSYRRRARARAWSRTHTRPVAIVVLAEQAKPAPATLRALRRDVRRGRAWIIVVG